MNRLRSLALVAMVAGALAGMQSAVADAPCLEDLDGNGEVGGDDISVMLLDFGLCPGCDSDLDGDGEVLVSDVSLLLLSFGQCAGPSWATVLEWSPDPAVIYDANLRTDIAAAHRPWRVRDNGTGIEMVLIPPGTFIMGCSASNNYVCFEDETQHQVTLTNAFYMSRTEVTQAQWVARMGDNPSNFTSNLNCPVERVSWIDIQPFCATTGMRLPTEAEWEYAYRAGTTTAFHGMPGYLNGTNDDSQLGEIAWYINNATATNAVGGKAANGFGLYDMSGNVWEWCQDLYGSYASGSQTNPNGPATGTYRVMRGGSWNTPSTSCRASRRDDLSNDYRDRRIGFRVARTP